MSALTTYDHRPQTVTLGRGFVVPVEALQLAWHLEEHGVNVVAEPDGTLRVGPRELLTDADRALIRKWRDHLVAIAQYQAHPQAGVEAVTSQNGA